MLLAICEPLLVDANKVVLVIPQQTRRMGPSWRHVGPPRYRKSSQEVQYHRYHGPPAHYHSKKSLYTSPPFPHGGDDFDQGYEHVNHVHIPHGKGVTHAITYGKGYVPYDQIKGTFSFGRERHQSPQQEHKQQHSEPEYTSSSFTSSDADYPPSGHSYESSQPEMFFTDAESALKYNERRNDRKKYYTSRSIEKDPSANSAVDLAGVTTENDQLHLLQQKTAELRISTKASRDDKIMATVSTECSCSVGQQRLSNSTGDELFDRTMPIQTSPFHTFPVPINIAIPQNVHG
ncbi:hypothetical protein ANTQUA_LOCUS1393 [Anthophora quadrimaculata]